MCQAGRRRTAFAALVTAPCDPRQRRCVCGSAGCRGCLREEHAMARIAGVPVGEAGVRVRLVYFFTRRSFARLTGCAPPGGIEPLEIYALVPGLLRRYGRVEHAPAKARRLDWRAPGVPRLKAPTALGGG